MLQSTAKPHLAKEIGMADDQNAVAEVEEELAPDAAVVEESVGEEEAVADAPVGTGTATLTVKRGGVATTDSFDFQAPAIIGRFDPTVGPIDVDLGNLPEAAYVSRKHAKITQEDGVWKLHDLGSSNGTFILRSDFERVEEAELADGDEIALGNARFVFNLAN
jgi:pSer/pThr/pTyr-binding forkhead associated (FHA) protein